eukprot:gb/GECH01012862.1/.p1 GENE.gb/GECH01012862.1/~~gb/GECH01012862.1/.p1  ORF type:complete len:167 (+),score=27.69 gb/GECH01012862.1/:1-501(+)
MAIKIGFQPEKQNIVQVSYKAALVFLYFFFMIICSVLVDNSFPVRSSGLSGKAKADDDTPNYTVALSVIGLVFNSVILVVFFLVDIAEHKLTKLGVIVTDILLTIMCFSAFIASSVFIADFNNDSDLYDSPHYWNFWLFLNVFLFLVQSAVTALDIFFSRSVLLNK